MTDDELLPAAELAGEHLDGNVDALADAQVSQAASLLAHRFATLRGQLADVPPASASARDAAIAAALAVFDTVPNESRPDDTARAQSAPVTSLASRRYRRWMTVAGVAAAVAAVGVIGVTALGGRGNDESTSISAKTSDTDILESSAAETAGDARTSGGAETPPEAGTEPAMASTFDDVAVETTAAAEAAPESTISAINSPASVVAIINSSTELRSFVTAQADPAAIIDRTSACIGEGETLLAFVIYQGTDAEVILRANGTEVAAVNAADCSTLEQLTL